MRDIRRPDSSEPIVDRLTNPEASDVRRAIFPTIMDLLIFAAAVGVKYGKSCPVSSSGKAVPFRVFSNNQKDGFIYLIALAHAKDPSILSEARSDEAAKIFEEFAAGGLLEIEIWLNENPLDSSGVSSLLKRIQNEFPQSGIIETSDLDPI